MNSMTNALKIKNDEVYCVDHGASFHKNYNENIDWLIDCLIDYCFEIIDFVLNTWFVWNNDILKFTNFVDT